MVTKVNGGIKVGVYGIAGHLSYFKVVATGATFLNEIQTVSTDANDGGAATLLTFPNTALEALYKTFATRSTVVILAVENDTTVHIAIENAGDGWVDLTASPAASPNDELEAALAANLHAYDSAISATPGSVLVTVGSFRVA